MIKGLVKKFMLYFVDGGKIVEILNTIRSVFQKGKLDGRSDNGFERRATSARDA